jgi:probable HAF family extracellular repeat protein
MRIARLLVATTVAVLASMPVPVSAQSYAIVDLGTLGTGWSEANALNNLGQVVGYYGSNRSRAFYWDPASGMIDIGALSTGPNAFSTIAYGINDGGQVVGLSSAPGDGFYHAFSWKSSTGMVDLGTLGGNQSMAFGINNSGQIVGTSQNSSNSKYTAVLWQNGVIQDVGQNGASDVASAINDAGMIVGRSGQGPILIQGTSITSLGNLGLPAGAANAINASGIVVGGSNVASGGVAGFVWANGAISNLGTLGGSSGTNALGVNAAGVIVGQSPKDEFGTYHAFIYSGGILQDLNDLVTPNSGFTIINATDINSSGQIVGSAITGGQRHAVLLSPIPEPAAYAMMLAGLALIAVRSKVAMMRRIARL